MTPRLGLHARPAARFVQTVGQFDATVTAENLTAPAGPASARSLNGVATLGVQQGHEVLIRATGPQAAQVLAAVRELAGRDFDEPPAAGRGPPSRRPQPRVAPPSRSRPRSRPAEPPPAAAARPADGTVLRGIPGSPGPGRRGSGPSAADGGGGASRARRRPRRRARPAGRGAGGDPARRAGRPGLGGRPDRRRVRSGHLRRAPAVPVRRGPARSGPARHPRGQERRRRLGQRGRRRRRRMAAADRQLPARPGPRPGQHQDRCTRPPAGCAPRGAGRVRHRRGGRAHPGGHGGVRSGRGLGNRDRHGRADLARRDPGPGARDPRGPRPRA